MLFHNPDPLIQGLRKNIGYFHCAQCAAKKAYELKFKISGSPGEFQKLEHFDSIGVPFKLSISIFDLLIKINLLASVIAFF